MTITVVRRAERAVWGADFSTPLMLLLGAFLCGLVLLPLGWLAWYSVTDVAGRPTLGNFGRLASDPTFVKPYATAVIIAGLAWHIRNPPPGLQPTVAKAPTLAQERQ